LRGLLEQHPDFEVVGEGQDGVEALELCRRLRPEVVLMDARMPKMDGLEATRAIKRELPSTIVLINTAIEEPNHLSEALRAGVSGYVLKTSSGSEITGAIRKALNGEDPLNQEISAQLLRRLLCEEEESRSFEQPQRAPLLGSFVSPRGRRAAAGGKGANQPTNRTKPPYQREHRKEAHTAHRLKA
jgi:DNA-binding NarL/FixJ family response regulator